jgi:hypothetical protein
VLLISSACQTAAKTKSRPCFLKQQDSSEKFFLGVTPLVTTPSSSALHSMARAIPTLLVASLLSLILSGGASDQIMTFPLIGDDNIQSISCQASSKPAEGMIH